MKLWIIMAVVFLFIHPSYADTGLRMIAIKCNKKNDFVSIAPFVLWNGSTEHNSIILKDPVKNSYQKIKNNSYYYIDKMYGKSFSFGCKTNARLIKIILFNKQMSVKENYMKKENAFSVDLETEISSSWDVYGSMYELRSSTPKKWETCFGSEVNKEMKCSKFNQK